MKPSHRQRLPVSKPSFGHRSRTHRHLEAPSSLPAPNTDSGSPVFSFPEVGEPGKSKLAAVTSVSVTPSSHDSNQSTTASDARKKPPASIPIPFAKSVTGSPVASNAIEIVVDQEEDRPFELGDLFTRQFAARNSSFLISLAVHTLMLLLLSLVLIHSTGKALIMLELMSSPDVEEFAGDIAQVDVNINDLEELIAGVDEDPFDAAFGDSDGNQRVVDESQLAGTAGGGDDSHAKGDGKSAKFFGMRAMGNKFVYVLDHSGSMAYESTDVNEYKVSRFDVARLELINSVESLRPHQEFYVVLFATGMEQMFSKNNLVPTAVKATPENKAKLKEWLWRNQAQGGTDPRGSLKMAFKMNPDAIFMLSDGEFRDEKKDGNPLAIDITRKQVEDVPIQINSIALEDDASKRNMEELSTVSGGKFKFVKVKDYISKMANSPADYFRSRAPDRLKIQSVSSWTKRLEYAEKLIPLLESNQPTDRDEAEKKLHELSFGVFEFVIPSVSEADVDAATITKAVIEWTDVFAQAGGLAKLDPSTPHGLFKLLANTGSTDYLTNIEALNAEMLSPLNQIAVARSILDFQQGGGGVDKRTRTALLEFLRELNKESTAVFSEASFIEKASYSTCKRRLATVLKNRRLRASRIYGKVKNKRLDENVRREFAKDLIALYPETDVARKAAEDLKIPVSHVDQN